MNEMIENTDMDMLGAENNSNDNNESINRTVTVVNKIVIESIREKYNKFQK